MLHFGDCQPSNPRLMSDRGFAFLDIEEENLETALALDGSSIKNRPVRVSEARPREDRPYGGGGGGGRSYGGGGGGGDRGRGGYGGDRGGRDRDRRR